MASMRIQTAWYCRGGSTSAAAAADCFATATAIATPTSSRLSHPFCTRIQTWRNRRSHARRQHVPEKHMLDDRPPLGTAHRSNQMP